MKIFIHQRKLVAENLTKHLTNNTKEEKNSQFMAIPKYLCKSLQFLFLIYFLFYVH